VARRADATGFLTTAIAILPYRQNAVLLAKQAARFTIFSVGGWCWERRSADARTTSRRVVRPR
jgi:hypothetical protein